MSLLAERVSQYKKDEDNIRRALLTAERMADKIQREAQQSAQEQLDSAEKERRSLFPRRRTEPMSLKQRLR